LHFMIRVLTWPEYRKQIEINRITCNIIHD
jgi:hypothetical protein